MESKLKEFYRVILWQIVGCCISSKHGFHPLAPVSEVSLVFWTGVFLSPGRRVCVIGKETGPGPGGYG